VYAVHKIFVFGIFFAVFGIFEAERPFSLPFAKSNSLFLEYFLIFLEFRK